MALPTSNYNELHKPCICSGVWPLKNLLAYFPSIDFLELGLATQLKHAALIVVDHCHNTVWAMLIFTTISTKALQIYIDN